MRSPSLGSVVLALLFAAGCATTTPPSDGSGTTSPAGTDNGTGSTDDGTSSGDNGSGGTPGSTSGDPGKPAAPVGALATDVSVTEIAVLQAVSVDVMKDGQNITSRNAPVVAGRDALVRVYVAPGKGFSSRSLTAELSLTDGSSTKLFKDTKTISGASSDSSLNSTFDIEVPGASITEGAKYTVAVRDTAQPLQANQTGDAQFPTDGRAISLGAASSGTQLKVVVVPVQYAADGSNRTPDVSQTQLTLYKNTMLAFYPAATIDISVRAPWPYTHTISASGNGFGTVLQALQNLRDQDGVGDDVYYYGAFAPTSSFNSYCGGGCVTGLSTVGDDPRDAFVRASVGIGFSGDDSAITMAHELGHAHGRNHAPCGGASGVDPQFPYSDGGIGAWGYNIVTKQLVSPSSGKDIMGYCQPEWVSDYTFSALFDRMQIVNGAKSMHGAALAAPTTYRYVQVAEDGTLTWGDQVVLKTQPFGETHTVTWTSPDGTVRQSVTGHYYRFDHIGGGYMLVPEGPAAATHAEVTGLLGRAVTTLAR